MRARLALAIGLIGAIWALFLAVRVFDVPAGHEIVDGEQVAISQVCGSTFDILVLDRYDSTVRADRPGQAQFVDPEGRSPQRQCYEQAKSNAITIGFLLAFTAAGVAVAFIARPQQRRSIDDIGPLPG